MVDWGITIAPARIKVSFVASPVVMLHSLLLINNAEDFSGLADWITRTAQALSPQQRRDLAIVCLNLSDKLAFDYRDKHFPELIDHIDRMTADGLRDESCYWMQHKTHFTSYEEILNDENAYLDFMRNVYAEKGEKVEALAETVWRDNFVLLRKPDQLKQMVVDMLSFMWNTHLKQEWKRTENMLQESTQAFSTMNYGQMDVFEIVETVTNRDLRGKDYFEEEINKAKHLIFMPSPHLGPYVSWLSDDDTGDDIILFGARMPKNAPKKSAELNRSELLVRLNALADETRLVMLDMLAKEGEICAQDFITSLDLSQSSASRHLRQLTASGYITERRRDVAKCYTLNRERIKDTIKALSQYIE